MPKAPKTNRTTSSPSNHPYASASAHRTTAMDVSHLTPAPATERSSASPWTEGDDRTLMEARQTPLSWAQIAGQHFPSKTPNACRKRYERLMEKRKNHDNWDVEAMAQAYMEVREPMWQMLASRLSQTWQAVEGKCMEKGLKTLQHASRTVARRDRDGRDHHRESDDSSSHLDDFLPPHRPHPIRPAGSDPGHDEFVPYRGDDKPPLHPADMPPSSSYNTPRRPFSTAATTPTSYVSLPVVPQGPSHVLAPMQSSHESSPSKSIPGITSLLHPVTTH